MNTLIKVGINAVALWVAAFLVSGITFAGPNGKAGWMSQIVTLLIIGAIFGILNALVKPLLKLLSLPFIVITLGLFTFIVNALMLQLTSWVTSLTPLSFHINTFFWDAILGAIIVSVVSMVLNTVLPTDD